MSTWTGNTNENVNIEVYIDDYVKFQKDINNLKIQGKRIIDDEDSDPIFDAKSIAQPLGKGGTAPLYQVND